MATHQRTGPSLLREELPRRRWGYPAGSQVTLNPPTRSRTVMDPGIWPYLAAAWPGGDVHHDAAWVVVAKLDLAVCATPPGAGCRCGELIAEAAAHAVIV